MHATPAVSVSLASPLSQKLADTLAAEAKRKILELEPEGCVRGPVMIDSGDPAKVVACAAKEFHADLLVIGRHGGIHDGSGEEGYLRHNAYAVIRGAPCPVISI